MHSPEIGYIPFEYIFRALVNGGGGRFDDRRPPVETGAKHCFDGYTEVLGKRERIDEVENVREKKAGESHAERFERG